MAAKQEKFNLGNVLVIGGCGFLGHHVVNLILRDYIAKVSVVDLRCTNNRRPDSDKVRYFEADITDPARVLSIFEEVKADVVIHTASPAPQANESGQNALFFKVNVTGTKNILEACKKTHVTALVYTSSASIISDNQTDLINADERWPVIRGAKQTNYYSETKVRNSKLDALAAAEELALEANDRSTKFLTCAIRPAGIMGEGDTMALYHMINLFRQGRHRIQVGDNNNLFDFTYVENVAQAHLLAAKALTISAGMETPPLEHEKVDGEAFFVTNGEPIYFWDFSRTVWKHAGATDGLDRVWVMPRGVGMALGWASELVFGLLGRPPTLNRQRITFSCMTRYYDISKARRRLGYQPLVGLDEGIRRGVDWSLEQEKKKVLK